MNALLYGMDWTTIYWLCWLGIVFLPVEIYAAVTKRKTRVVPGDTFSELVWWAFGIKGRRVRWARARRFILTGFMVSLTTHFVLGWGPHGLIAFGPGIVAVFAYALIKERGSR